MTSVQNTKAQDDPLCPDVILTETPNFYKDQAANMIFKYTKCDGSKGTFHTEHFPGTINKVKINTPLWVVYVRDYTEPFSFQITAPHH